jgi:hypothetical protein
MPNIDLSKYPIFSIETAGEVELLSDEETSLIENYRLANDAGKVAIMATAQAQAAIAKREESKPGEKAE